MRPVACIACFLVLMLAPALTRAQGAVNSGRSSPRDWMPPRTADGQLADVAGGREVSLEQRRRHAKQARVVVETVRGIVWRQQRGGVDFERQQITDGVRVLAAVQAVQRVAARIRMRRRGAIERPFKMLDQRM